MHIGVWWGNLKEGGHLEDLGIDGKRLEWMLTLETLTFCLTRSTRPVNVTARTIFLGFSIDKC